MFWTYLDLLITWPRFITKVDLDQVQVDLDLVLLTKSSRILCLAIYGVMSESPVRSHPAPPSHTHVNLSLMAHLR